MRRLSGSLALVAAGLALWVLFTDPAVVGPLSGGKQRPSSKSPGTYSFWAVGVLMGLSLAWLTTADWSKLKDWLRRQRGRIGLLLLGGLLAGVLFKLKLF
jgi:hypothetical protein